MKVDDLDARAAAQGVRMIFPGMDPYLENPSHWPGVHAAFVVYLRDRLQPLLRPRYTARIEQRVFVEGPDREIIPDAWIRERGTGTQAGAAATVEVDTPIIVHVPSLEIHESYVAIIDRTTRQNVVTVIEVVSPTNKFPGHGRDSYLCKQREVRASQAHLVEIDFLRMGPHVLMVPEWAARGRGDYDYLVCVNRAVGLRNDFELYRFGLKERIPRIGVPLAPGDADAPLDLQAVMERTIEAGSLVDELDYDAPCVPPLRKDDQDWANERISDWRVAPRAANP